MWLSSARFYTRKAKGDFWNLGGMAPLAPLKSAYEPAPQIFFLEPPCLVSQPSWFKLQAALFLRNNVYFSLIISFTFRYQFFTANTQINEKY